MLKAISTVLIIIFFHISNAQIISVKQDGSGDYTSIQEAVDFAVDGDTVLVWPGTYTENVDFLEKSICLGSLTMTTGDMTYNEQTIIDANHIGGCINIEHLQDSAEINGFTLINGIGSWAGSISGGAINMYESNVKVKNCIINYNYVTGNGGGIYSEDSYLFLSNCIIKNNVAYRAGGGIKVLGGSIEFDSINRCSVYSNYAVTGTDFCKADCPPVHIYLDTCTVAEPDHYYLYSIITVGYPDDDITYSINAGKIEQSNQDLYVSPDGNNNNSGLTPDDPLKNISYALLKIASDSLEPDTIHLVNGYYAPSTGEKFPLNLKSFVSIVGENTDSTILDGEEKIHLLHSNYSTNDFTIQNMTFQHGNANISSPHKTGAFRLFYNRDVVFNNLVFKENTGRYHSAGGIYKCSNFLLKNIEFVNNFGGKSIIIGTSYDSTLDPPGYSDTVILQNCHFKRNIHDTNFIDVANGGAILFQSGLTYPDSLVAYVYNSEFNENFARIGTSGPQSSSIAQHYGSKVFVINSNIAKNSSDNPIGATIGILHNATLNVYNSIIYDNLPAQFYLNAYSGSPKLNIYHSLVQDGIFGIKIYSPNTQLHYDQSNINANPLWDTTGPVTYMLTAGSPCIDAGTLDLPQGVELPETDILGNPRNWGAGVDMGAYEYGPWVGVDYRKPIAKSQQLKAGPNPFYQETRIRYQSKEKGKQSIFVYDINGNKVTTLLDITGQPGRGEIIWDGRNDYGRRLPAGVYVVEFVVNEESRGSVKVVKK